MSTSRPPPVAVGKSGHVPDPVVALLSGSLVAVLVVDEQGDVAYANPWAATLFQRPVDTLVGQPATAVVTEGDQPRLRAWMRAVLDHSMAPAPGHERVLRTRRPDGSTPSVELSLSLLDPGGGRRWVVLGLNDVTAREEAEARVTHLSKAYLMLAQLNQAVIDAPDAAALFTSTTRICVEQGGFLGSSVAVPAPDGRVEMVATAGDVDDFVASLVISLDPQDPYGCGPTARALRDGQPCFVPDFLGSDVTAPWRDVAVRHGVGAVVALPLRTDGRVVASLSIYADRANAFGQGVAELFHQVADNVSHALDGYVAEQALVAEGWARRALLERLVTAEETERAHIAAGLHDDSVQTLAAVELRLGLLLRKLGDSPGLDPCATMVRTIRETVKLASTSLRNLLFELEPPLLAQSLDDALQTVARHVLEDQPTVWSVSGAGAVVLPEAALAAVLRIVKEALINVRKHAAARHVVITVRQTGPGVELTVTDDGVGLPASTAAETLSSRPGHRGLMTMRDRASAAGGWLQLERAAAGGTVVRFFLPLGEHA